MVVLSITNPRHMSGWQLMCTKDLFRELEFLVCFMCGDMSFICRGIDYSLCQSSRQFIIDFSLTLLVVLAKAVLGQPLSPGCKIEPHCGRTPSIV